MPCRTSPDGRLLFLVTASTTLCNGALLTSGTFTQGTYSADYSLAAVNTSNGCDVYRVAPASWMHIGCILGTG
ncbi:MAG: hypothetical protein U0694_21585 [Anaerolineae bacterium]